MERKIFKILCVLIASLFVVGVATNMFVGKYKAGKGTAKQNSLKFSEFLFCLFQSIFPQSAQH